jgi:hypothetical protein
MWILWILQPVAVFAQAFPEQFVPPDARSAALGGAFAAVASGPNAAWWNPGALLAGPNIYVTPFSYTEPFPLIEQTGGDQWKVGVGAASAVGAVGVGAHYDVLRLELSSIKATTQIARVAAGYDLTRLWSGTGGRVRCGLGLSGKLFHSSFKTDDGLPGAGSSSGSTVDMDVGTRFSYRNRDAGTGSDPLYAVHVGVVSRNTFDRQIRFGDGPEGPIGGGLVAAVAVQSGFAHDPKVGYLFQTLLTYEEDWYRKYRETYVGAASFEYDSGFFDYARPAHHVGAEAVFAERLALRTGHIDDPALDIHDWSWGIGAGTRMSPAPDGARKGLIFNYARVPGQIFGGEKRVDHFEISGWIAR